VKRPQTFSRRDGSAARPWARAALLFALPLYHFAALPLPSWAINADAGTAGGSFLKIGAGSARAVSMGRAYVALAEGTDALLWNPAGIAVSSQRELSVGVTSWVQDVSAQTLGYIQPLGRTVLGVGATYLSVNGFDVRDDNGVPLNGDKSVVRDGAAYVSVAHSFLFEKLFLGLTLKEVYEDNGGPRQSTLVEDLGAILKPTSVLSFGAAIQNLSNDKTRVASTQRLGAAYKPSSFFDVSVELSKDSDNQSRVGAGAEFILPEEVLTVGQLAFRVGYYEADAQGENRDNSIVKSLSLQRTSGLSFGMGLFSTGLTGYGLGLDYSFVPMGALGVSNQIVFRILF
jgi:hypothetical protein